MVIVTYNGPGARLLAFGKTLLRGQSDEFTEAEAASLEAQPAINVAVTASPRPPASAGRVRWVTYAESVGVAVTEEMSRNEIIAVVDKPDSTEAAEPVAEPEADPGEGHHDNPDDTKE